MASAVVAAVVGLSAGPVGALAPRDQGWWTATNPPGLPASPPAPPDVPARGFLVQGGPNAPTAYAALVYELDPGATAQTLTLTVAPNSVTTPSTTLQVCQLLQPINHPDQGGPISDAPPYNCGKKATAAPDASSKSYKFDVSGLAADGLVAVAILPAGPADRVAFSAPDANSLATVSGPSDATTPATDAGLAAAPTDASALPTDGLSSAPFVGSAPSADATLPGSSVAPPAAAAAPALPSNTRGAFVPVATSVPAKATGWLVVLFVVAAAGGAGLWLWAGRQSGGPSVSGPAPA